jgi:two-component sensor histidine kinase
MRWITIIAFFFLMLPMTHGQTVDSLLRVLPTAKEDTAKVRMLRKLAWKYNLIDFDSSLMFYYQSLSLAEKLDAKEGQILALLGIKQAYTRRGKLDSSTFMLHRAMTVAEQYQKPRFIAMVHGGYGQYYHEDVYKPDSALYHYGKDLEILRKAGLEYEMWAPLKGRGEVYYNLGMNDKAEADILEALRITATRKIRMDYGLVIFRLIRNYFDLKEWDKYSKWSEDYIAFVEEGNSTRDRSNAYHRGLYFFEDDARAADVIPTLQQITTAHEKNGHYNALIDALEYLSGVQWRAGKKKDAIATLETALQWSEKRGNLLLQDIYLLRLSEMYEADNNVEKAFEAFKRHKMIQDSVEIIDNRDHIAEIEVKFETAKKDEALLRQNFELEKRKLANRNFMWIVILLSILILTLAIFIINKMRATRSLAEKNAIISAALDEKQLLLNEIHHRVKNNLQVISSLLNLQSKYIEDPAALAAIKEGRNRVNSMSLIHQNLYGRADLTAMDVSEYLEKLSDNLFQSYNIDRDRISLVTEVDPISLDIDLLIPLGLILNELISNSLKHAFPADRKGTITVRLKRHENALVLDVSDDGIGMQANASATTRQSFGMEIVHAFAHKLKAQLDIQQQPGISTRLTIPTAA